LRESRLAGRVHESVLRWALCERSKSDRPPDIIGYAVIKAFSGCASKISWLAYLLALVLVLYFVFVRSRMSQPRFQASFGSGSSDKAGLVAVLGTLRCKAAIRTPMACQK
jgi:hypothetical protein